MYLHYIPVLLVWMVGINYLNTHLLAATNNDMTKQYKNNTFRKKETLNSGTEGLNLVYKLMYFQLWEMK